MDILRNYKLKLSTYHFIDLILTDGALQSNKMFSLYPVCFLKNLTTKKGEEIILGTGMTENGRPYFRVQDSGIGMKERDVKHMFDRFYRSDEAGSYEGTGLGLSIAKWIVDKHGAYFEIVSREDLGTRIDIVLKKNAPGSAL